MRKEHQEELESKCKMSQIPYPPKFVAKGTIPKLIKPADRLAHEIIVLPNESSNLYKLRIVKDKYSRHLKRKYDNQGKEIDPNFKELKWGKIIFHMDYDPLTEVGIFFTKPSSDQYLMSENSDNLLQLNFFNKDL